MSEPETKPSAEQSLTMRGAERTKAIKDACMEYLLSPVDARPTMTQIADRFGVSVNAISKHIRKLGTDTGLAGGEPKFSDDFAAKIRAGDQVCIDNYERICRKLADDAIKKGSVRAAKQLMEVVERYRKGTGEQSQPKSPMPVSIQIAMQMLPTAHIRAERAAKAARLEAKSQDCLQGDIEQLNSPVESASESVPSTRPELEAYTLESESY